MALLQGLQMGRAGQLHTPRPESHAKAPQSAVDWHPPAGWQVPVTPSQLFETHSEFQVQNPHKAPGPDDELLPALLDEDAAELEGADDDELDSSAPLLDITLSDDDEEAACELEPLDEDGTDDEEVTAVDEDVAPPVELLELLVLPPLDELDAPPVQAAARTALATRASLRCMGFHPLAGVA